jgi:hypothetical protein
MRICRPRAAGHAVGVLLSLLLAAPAAAAEPPATTGTVGGVRLGGTGVVVAPGRGGAVPPAVRAQSCVVADALTGEVLAAKGAHVRLPPASTVKTLTALTVHPKLDVGTVVVASRGDAAVEGSRAGLVPGGTYTVGDLYNGLFLRSGNDASTALARVAGGSGGIARTVADMAAQARNWVPGTPRSSIPPGWTSRASSVRRTTWRCSDGPRYGWPTCGPSCRRRAPPSRGRCHRPGSAGRPTSCGPSNGSSATTPEPSA